MLYSTSAVHAALRAHCMTAQGKTPQPSALGFFPLLLWAEILKGALKSHVTKFNGFEFSY